MKTTLRTSLAAGTLLACAAVAFATASNLNRRTVSAQAPDPLIERGRYLVENVGMCADCHTARTEKGEFDRSRWLMGAALPFQPTVPMPWSPVAPPIAGLPSMTEAQGLDYLKSGKLPDGSMSRPPMPEFRFDHDDAVAVVAYLKSLVK
jgi:hypothetical protein